MNDLVGDQNRNYEDSKIRGKPGNTAAAEDRHRSVQRGKPRAPEAQKAPTRRVKKSQGNLILKPTFPKKSCRPLHCRLRSGRRRLFHEIVLPHVAALGGTLSTGHASHATWGTWQRTTHVGCGPPPPVILFKAAVLVVDGSSKDTQDNKQRESRSMNRRDNFVEWKRK
jgi:hypothetical protein